MNRWNAWLVLMGAIGMHRPSGARHVSTALGRRHLPMDSVFQIHEKNLPDDNSSPLDILRNTTCEACSSSTSHKFSNADKSMLDNYYRIAIVIQHQISEEVLTLTAGLIGKNMKVFLTAFGEHGNASVAAIRDRVAREAPCNIPVSELLRVSYIPLLEARECDSLLSQSPMDSCSLDRALEIHAALDVFVESNSIEAMIVDATMVGGLLLAERRHLPVFIFSSLGVLEMLTRFDPLWAPKGWNVVRRVYELVQQRGESLLLTLSFIKLNRIRKALGMTPVRVPIQYFQAVAAVFVTPVPHHDSSVPVSIERDIVRFVRPFHPEDVPCLVSTKKAETEGSQPIVILAPAGKLDIAGTQAILHALLLTRKSLRSFNGCKDDDCDIDEPAFDIRIMTQGLSTKLIESLPSGLPHIKTIPEHIGIVESILLHPGTRAVFIHCNTQAVFLDDLDVPFFCISSDERFSFVKPLFQQSPSPNPEEMAVQILHMMRSVDVEKSASPKVLTMQGTGNQTMLQHVTFNGMVEVIYRAAELNRKHGSWNTSAELLTALSVSTSIGEQRKMPDGPYDSFTVLIAWIVLLTCLVYMVFGDSLLSKQRRRSPHRVESMSRSMVNRLGDLDDALFILYQWYQEQPSLSSDVDIPIPSQILSPNERSSTVPPSPQGNNLRRRRRR